MKFNYLKMNTIIIEKNIKWILVPDLAKKWT